MPDTKRYARLKALLQEKITSGAYEPGDRFFSQNELMRKYGLSFSTVIRALDELVADGYLVRQQGKGTFIASTSARHHKEETEQKLVTIFAPWQNVPSGAFGQINAADFYHGLNDLKPDWMHLRLVPIKPTAEALEPWLFTKEPTHAAVALYPTLEQSAILYKMAEQYPIVAVAGETAIPGISCIVTSFADAARLGVQKLIHEGHTAIAIILPCEPDAAADACLKGYRTALREAAYPFHEQLVMRCQPSDPTGYHATLRLFDLNSSVQITSVIAVGSALLPGVLYAGDAMRLTSDDRFAVTCIDDQQTAGELAMRTARVIFPVNGTARAVVSALMGALASSPADSVSVPAEHIPAKGQQDA